MLRVGVAIEAAFNAAFMVPQSDMTRLAPASAAPFGGAGRLPFWVDLIFKSAFQKSPCQWPEVRYGRSDRRELAAGAPGPAWIALPVRLGRLGGHLDFMPSPRAAAS